MKAFWKQALALCLCLLLFAALPGGARADSPDMPTYTVDMSAGRHFVSGPSFNSGDLHRADVAVRSLSALYNVDGAVGRTQADNNGYAYDYDLDNDGRYDLRECRDPALEYGDPFVSFTRLDSCSVYGQLSLTLSDAAFQAVVGEIGSAYPRLVFDFGTRPVITKHPEPVSALAGTTAVFKVQAQGQGLSYQWWYSADGGNIYHKATATGNKTATLKVPATVSRNGYKYYCVVMDQSGERVGSMPADLCVVEDRGLYTLHFEDVEARVSEANLPPDMSGLGGLLKELMYQAATLDHSIAYSVSFFGAYFDLDGDGDPWRDMSFDQGSGYFMFALGNQNKTVGTVTVNVSPEARLQAAVKQGLNWTYSGIVFEVGNPLRLPDGGGVCNCNCFAGETAVFTVQALGEGLKYQWYYSADDGSTWNKATASGNKTDTLSVPATASRDGYNYRCQVTDKDGYVKESGYGRLTIVENAGPYTLDLTGGDFRAPYTNQTYVKIESLLDSAETEGLISRLYGGECPPELIHSEEGCYNTLFDLDKDGVYDLERYMLSDGTTWVLCPTPSSALESVTISPKDHFAGSSYNYENKAYSSLTILLRAKPVIVTQPSAQTVAEGGTAVFSVTATGANSYQWQYKTASGSWHNATASGNKTDTLTVPATASRNGYSYRCKVTNATGTTISNAAELTVSSGPVITKQPTNQTVKLGEKASFSVTATGTDLSYLWYYKTPSGSSFVKTTSTAGKTANYSITTQAKHDGYQYYCLITDGSGNTATTDIVTLTLSSAPVITKQPTAVTAAEGSNAAFTVTATIGTLSYQWQYKTPTGSWHNATAEGNKTATLNVPATASRNGYSYRCKVTNAAGTVISDPATLTVAALPVITRQPSNVSEAEGEMVSFVVEATGSDLNYQWQYKTPTGSWKNSSADGNKWNVLTVEATSSRNGYSYRCKVTNAAGTVISDPATLTVAALPVITRQPSNVSEAEGEMVNFVVEATGSDLSYQWQYKTPTGSWKNSPADGNKWNVLTVEATSSRNGYSYRCIVSNAGGTVISDPAVLTVN